MLYIDSMSHAENKSKSVGRKSLGVLFAFTISILIFYVIYLQLDLEQIRQRSHLAMLLPLSVNALLYLCTMILRAWRFSYLFKKVASHKLSILDAADLVFVNNLGNHLLPMRLGEVAFLAMAKRQFKLSIDKLFMILFFARLGDLALLIFLFGGALIVLNLLPGINYLCFVAGIFGLIFLFQLPLAVRIADPVLKVLASCLPTKIAEKALSFWHKIKKVSEEIHSSKLHAINLLFSFFVWLSNITFFYLEIRALNIDTSYFSAFIGGAGAAILPSLPINALGTLGPLEAGWIGGFVMASMSESDAAFSALVVHTVMLVASSIFFSWTLLRLGRQAIVFDVKA